VFLDVSYLAHLEKVKSRYPVEAMLAYPIKEGELEQVLLSLEED
jgi:hypothetical protein